MEASGFDAIQSLLMAMQMIGADLYTSEYHKNGQISFWTPDWGGYGFPVPSNMRHALVGEDAKFF